MSVLAWIVLGGLAGWIASTLMKTDSEMGAAANIIVGIVGGLIGGWLITLFGNQSVTGFSFPSLAVSVLGAVILLWIVRGFQTPLSGKS